MQHQQRMHSISMEIIFASKTFSLSPFVRSLTLIESLRRAFNGSLLFRQCFYSIFTDKSVCDKEIYPFSYEYSKIFWKLVMSSCAVNHRKSPSSLSLSSSLLFLVKESCQPSHLSQQTLLKCHYSFDDKYPTRCR